jgi:DNA-binding response OmpR family regulator
MGSDQGRTNPVAKAHYERRNEPRVEASLRVQFESLDELVIAYTADISQGGLFISTRDFVPVGSFVSVDLELPDGVTVRTIARVAHHVDEEERAGMGMELVETKSGGLVDQLGGYLNVMLGDAQHLPSRDAPCRVLIVDDDESCREQVATVMRKRNHQVELAENGLLALGAVLRDPPDLIITDVQMPVMDGWNFLRVLRARPSVAHIPVVFLTMLSGEEERLKGYKLGVDDYINKPFLFEELDARVTRVLTRGHGSAAARNALRGDLSQVSLASVLQFVEIEKRTGLLLVVSQEEIATLHVRDGRVIHVDFGIPSPETGLERLMRVLDWTEGRFELTGAEVCAEDTIEEPISFALLEHARRRDEDS